MLDNMFILLKYWMIVELINWFVYLYIYINIITPRFLYYKNKDTEKIINRVDKLTKDEIEYVIKGCIMYDKSTHEKLYPEKINTSDLSKNELINLIGFSLFGLEIEEIKNNKIKYLKIVDLADKIEIKLGYKLSEKETNRYIYRKWGSNYIKFNFRPILIQIPLRLVINTLHYYFKIKLSFDYKICNKTKISYLYKIKDPNKKTIFFIHGFGFGYIPYIKTLIEFEKKYNLIIIIMPSISSYRYYDDLNYSYFPALKELRESIYNFIEFINVKDIIVMSHSFGTYISQILRKDSRSNIFKKYIMIDPIIFWIGCFKMSIHVDNPLVRKYPVYQYISDNLINFLIYHCIYLKYVCYRLMFGPDFWIYNSSELSGTNVTIILEKSDYVIPAELLYNKIKGKVDNVYIDDDTALHGSVLMDDKYLPILIDTIEK